jgi:hypothetical protein
MAGNLKEVGHWQDLGIHGRTVLIEIVLKLKVLKSILNKYVGKTWTGLCGSG